MKSRLAMLAADLLLRAVPSLLRAAGRNVEASDYETRRAWLRKEIERQRRAKK